MNIILYVREHIMHENLKDFEKELYDNLKELKQRGGLTLPDEVLKEKVKERISELTIQDGKIVMKVKDC